MADERLYRYWILRYVPDVVRGEYVNIGVVVGESGGDWTMRSLARISRLGRFGGYPDVARDWLHALERVAATPEPTLSFPGDETRPSVDWIERIRAQQNNMVQVAPPAPVRAKSAAAAAEMLFAALVSDEPVVDRSNARRQAATSLRTSFYESRVIGKGRVRTDVLLHAGRQEATFEFAVTSDRVVQVSQVWSFARRNPRELQRDIQSSSYAMRILRDRGGQLDVKRKSRAATTLPLVAEVPIRVLYVPPTGSEQKEVFEQAQEAWTELGIQSFRAGEEAAIVADAERLLAGV